MGSVVLVGDEHEAMKTISAAIILRFPEIRIQQVEPERVIGALLLEHISLIVYSPGNGEEVDLKVIEEIKSVSKKTPLLVYGHFELMQNDLLYLLCEGVHGLLSANSNPSEHTKAIDSLLRGGTYVDHTIKFQAMFNLLRS